MDLLNPVERRGGVGQFADDIVERALAFPDTAEIETQGRKTTFGKSLVHCLHDAVIHRAAALRMGMQEQGKGCARARRRAETALETAFETGRASWEGKSVSGRVEHGGGSKIKKK